MHLNQFSLYIFAMLLFFFSSSQAIDRETLRWMRSEPKITKIEIAGNKAISEGDIKSQMYSREFGFFKALGKDRRIYLQRETLRRDTLEIKFLYLKNGYLDIEIKEEFILNQIDSSATVLVQLSEGKLYRFGQKELKGSYDSKFGQNLNKMMKTLKAGKPFNIFLVRGMIFDMKTYLANEGYPYAVIDFTIDKSNDSEFDDILITVESDSLVHFGEVRIVGNDNFPSYTARREITIKQNNIYRRKDILNSQRRLLESGYYTTVRFEQDDTTESRLAPDFVLSVRERKPHYITFTTGAGQSEDKDLVWGLSARYGKRNFVGSRRYDILSDYSFTLGNGSKLIEHRYRVRFTEPWFLGIRMPLILTSELQPKIKDPNRNFDRQSWSLSAATTRRFGLKARTTAGFEYEFVEISGVPETEIELLKAEEGNSARRKIYFTFRRDSRDDLFVPRRGAFTIFSVEYVGGFLGGDDNFSKTQFSWSTYQMIKPDWISATRIKVGWARAFEKTQVVPIDEALFLGGANSVRGFSTESLGPIDAASGEVEGATYTILFNQEFRWKTLQVFNYLPILRKIFSSLPLWQSVFFDMGNGFRNLEDIKASAFAYSYGTGIQIMSPAGPIRFDYAQRIPTSTIPFDSRWHFTILYAF